MCKRIIILAVVGVFCITAAFAGGRQDNESHEAESPDGFTSSVPIESKKTGKWNFYIEAKDKGGNTTIAGPHNIYNDPESDLPVTTVINPIQNMHVQGNLNIVGVCRDDDGVSMVEFVITRGPDGKGEELVRTKAEGADFWSYLLDTTDQDRWPDGVYTITAWGTDINELSGISSSFPAKQHKFHRVIWNLDRKKPETHATSHEVGALVSGKINLKGQVQDGNGVQSLRYSLDGGTTYRPLPLKLDKRRNIYNWDLAIDTKTFEDGPNVLWFKATDGMGTIGMAAHLLFVNNTRPDVKILYPDPDAAVSGIFSVGVYAAHPVGMRGVSWRLGKDTGYFPMVIGNPYWIQDFDIRGQKANSIDLEIRAEDLSGNVTITKRKLKVDLNAGMFKVSVEEPADNAVLTDDALNIRGTVNSGDGTVSAIVYSIDSGAAVETPCSGNFQLIVRDLAPGAHTLQVWSKDVSGIEGPKTLVKNITVPGPLPEPRFASLKGGSLKTPRNFYSGMEINVEPKMTFDFAVKSAVAISSASVSFGGRMAMPVIVKAAGKDLVYHADAPLPVDLGSGLIKAELKVIDRYGREATYEEFFYAGSNGGGLPFEWVNPHFMDDGRILLSAADEPLIGLGGSLLSDARLTGTGSENCAVTIDEYGRAYLYARTEGSFGPLTLSGIGRDGGTYNSPAFRVLADFSEPSINMQGSPSGWVQNQVPVQFSVTDAGGLRAVEYSTDMGGSWQPVPGTSNYPSGSALSYTFDLASVVDGTVTFVIRAVDTAGRIALADIVVQKDTTSPEARLVLPGAEDKVNGTIRLGVAVSDAGALKSATYTRPAADGKPAISTVVYPYTPDEEGNVVSADTRFLNILLDSVDMPLDDNMRLVFEDSAGNRSELSTWEFVIDNEMDIPNAHVILPLEDEVIITDFEVSGIMFDDDMIRQVYWKLDDGSEQIIEATTGFSIPIALSSLTDNEHSVTVVAEDIYGVKSEPVTRNFRVSLREPVASVTSPAFDILAGGFVEMSGGGFDENGIAKVQVSLDNGNTFNDTRLNAYNNTAEWFYEFHSDIMKDGPHVIFIRVYDKYDISAIFSSLLNIDNTSPEITLDSPSDGAMTTGIVDIMGEVVDVNLEEKVIELRSLEGRQIPPGFKVVRVSPSPFLKETFDMSSLRDGAYNIEIQATDKAGNVSTMSKNIQLTRESKQNFVDILYPLNGETVSGNFNLYGNTGGIDDPGTVTLQINNQDVETVEVTWTGYYSFALNEEYLQPGVNSLVVHSTFGGTNAVVSETRTLMYQPSGPWVTIDSLTIGDFVYDRPWFTGRAGYVLSEEDQTILADKKADKDAKTAVQGKVLDYIDLSFDNGNTFIKTLGSHAKGVNWRYRLEDGEMAEGAHYIIVRANMKNGETAVTRTVLQVDKTAPRIRVITPEAGGRYNQDLEYAAMASDDVELASLTYHLRFGDKMLYEVPGFLQGLYFEGIIPPLVKQFANDAPAFPFAGGATYTDFGMGLSFFEDNVKIQVQYGFMTQDIFEQLGGDPAWKDEAGDDHYTVRYGGHVLGIKLLANIYTLPFGKIIGPDWEWLFASFAVGANFSLFDLMSEGYTQSGNPTWMSALLLQIEFPKVTIPKREKFRTFSFFTEGQLWFVPTDVDAAALGIETVIPHIILGLRMYIF